MKGGGLPASGAPSGGHAGPVWEGHRVRPVLFAYCRHDTHGLEIAAAYDRRFEWSCPALASPHRLRSSTKATTRGSARSPAGVSVYACPRPPEVGRLMRPWSTR